MTLPRLPLNGGASCNAGCGALFNLIRMRCGGWLDFGGDAADCQSSGLVRYDEVFEQGVIASGAPFTVQTSRERTSHPAPTLPATIPIRTCRHWACACGSTPRSIFPILAGYAGDSAVPMKKGLKMVADNGSNWYVSGAPDPR